MEDVNGKQRVCIVALQKHGLNQLVDGLNNRTDCGAPEFFYVTLLDADRQLSILDTSNQLQRLILQFRLGQWAELSEYFSRSPHAKWVYLSTESIGTFGQSNSVLQTAKAQKYYSSLMDEVARRFGIAKVSWTGEATKSLEDAVIDGINNQCNGISESVFLKDQFRIDRQNSQPTEKQLRVISDGVLLEVLRRNALPRDNSFSPHAKLPIVAEIRLEEQAPLLQKLTSKRSNYKGPVVRYFLRTEASTLERVDVEQVAHYIDLQAVEKLLFSVWCSVSFFAEAVKSPQPIIRATLCEDSSLTDITTEYRRNDRSIQSQLTVYRAIVDYLRQNSFWVKDVHQWETYPYREVANAVLLANRDCSIINSRWYDILTELATYTQNSREVVCHFSCDGENVFARKGNTMQKIPLSLEQTLERISCFDDIKVTDCSDKEYRRANRKTIRRIAKQFYIYTAGAVDSLDDVEDLLSHSIRKIVLPYPFNYDIAAKFPDTRLTVGVKVTGKNYDVVADGKLIPLDEVVAEFRSYHFMHSIEVVVNEIIRGEEAMLALARTLMLKLGEFCRIYIDCDPQTITELRSLWRFPKLVPIVSSVLWQSQQFCADIFSEMPVYDSKGQLSCTILALNGVVKCTSKINRKAIQQTYLTKKLHLCNPATSTVLQKHSECTIRKISTSCCRASMLFVCDSPSSSNFCERFDRTSCFRNQSVVKTNLSVINDHIKGKIHSKSYSGVMQNNPGLALAKVMEEFWEIICASNNDEQTIECSDFIVHFLMYINGKGVRLEDIVNELNARSYSPQLLPKFSKTSLRDPSVVSLGILNEKYFKSTDKFIEEELGIRIIRPTVPRKLLIQYAIADQGKYDKFFKGRTVSFLPLKSKDMPWMIAFGAIDGCITYTPVMDNYPSVSKCVHLKPVHGLRISLIKRKQDTIDLTSWNRNNKGIVACQHVNYVHQYFIDQGLGEHAFTLSRIVGSSQSYLITKTNVHFHLCDAVVETGLTLEANDLEEWRVIKKDGDISVGLFMSLKFKQ